jgi:hypothetical protein
MRSHDESSDPSHDRLAARSDGRPRPRTENGAARAAEGLAHRVAASLATRHDPDVLAAALAACARDPASYEASVRATPGGTLRAGRMMVEQATPEVLDAIASAVDVTLPPVTARWLELARQESVPLIAGWDLRGGGAERCVKLYVNASDASRAARVRLAAALAPDVAPGGEPAAVVGMNARPDGVAETKLYIQSADAVALANGLGARAEALAATARAEGADAGGVLSLDAVGGALRPRAFFVALREPPDDAGWRCVRSLPGYSLPIVESLLPFAPAPPRSVGISLDDGSWTLYCKPRDSGRAPQALEPAAIFRIGETEVGVFVEPTQQAARAFRRTERHAVSVRVREGDPSPQALEALVDWFTARLGASEHDGSRVAPPLADPPPPWRLVHEGQPRGGPGERS